MIKAILHFIAVFAAAFLLLVAASKVRAHDTVVINHIHIEQPPAPTPTPAPVAPVNEITEITSITEGISADALAEGIATAAAINHQFDFSYSGWQGSVNGAWYEGADAVSFGVANRFDWLDGALLHGSYTQNGSKPLYTLGGTWRF